MSGIRKIEKKTENPFLNFYEIEAVKRDGSTFPYYMASRAKKDSDLKINCGQQEDRPDGVAIFSLYGEQLDRVVLIRQYRYPLGGYIYELPAGLTEPGEDYHMTAIREMKEETGLTFRPVKADPALERPFYTTIGMTDECCSMVFGVSDGEADTKDLEETEDIQVVIADREEIRRILGEERVAIMCAYMLMHFLHNEKDPLGFLKL